MPTGKKKGILIAAWVAYLAVIGPYLISARSTPLVALGIGMLGALLYATYRTFRSLFGVSTNA